MVMKNLMKIGLLLALVVSISSCEKVKGLFDIDFDTTFKGDLEIEIPESELKSAEFHEFHSTVEVKIEDYDDIVEYGENIREINVDSILATVKDVNKDDVVFSKGTTFSIYDTEDKATWELENDWDIVVGTKITLGDIGTEKYNTVKRILEKQKAFTISGDGYCTQKGVSITIRLSINTTVVANPL